MKRKQDHQASKAAKRMASHADEHSKYEEQMMMVWKTRNILREECDKETLRLIKSQNGETPTSEQTNLNDCAERIVFGAFKPCPNCNKSSKYFKETSNGFVCTGGIANIPCEYVTEKRERCACKISEELKAKSPFLNSYSYTPLDRIQLNKDESCFIPEKLKHRCIHRESIVKQKPLGNIRVATIGKLEENMSNIRKKIENLGGIFHEQISKYVDLCVGRLDKLNKKLKEEIDNLGLPTVSEECLSAITGDNFDETITKYGVSNCTAEKVAKIKNTRKGFYSTNIISPSGLAITDPHSGNS
ncbi:uncharacterized protein TRIADDRAFT_61727 [Trichoplax adhaerens]|uniref:NAD(+) ADP-ribosyltransferase n=1 Tax=Trichoplax adhaerens TaxID=10228 RepID=B3SBT3_TRIAD|nr:hypothetical protein TRIADDRAFT_61727 [Trichoplax adhaerens]EDV19811.1 hypothetical protein TRIADDRAFT_61727 [Trichoplax adhaerens]|eukprot:XP_002117681.1 hypothetical protein TRIADDRAFT_61727 [Trichoplax adhaerens]